MYQRQGTRLGAVWVVWKRERLVAAVIYYDHMPTAIDISLPHYLSLHVSTCLIFSSGCRAKSLSSSSMIRNHADAAADGGGGWQASTRARKFGTVNLVIYLLEVEACTVLSLIAA